MKLKCVFLTQIYKVEIIVLLLHTFEIIVSFKTYRLDPEIGDL